MMTLQPSDARRHFFHLGELAAKGPLLVTASKPFVVVPLDWLVDRLPAPLAREPRHVDLELLGGLGLEDVVLEPMQPRLREPEL